MLLTVVLLACSSPAPPAPAPQPVVAPAPVPVPEPVAEPAPPPAPQVVLPDAVRDPSLFLGTYEIEQITAQQDAMAHIGDGDEALCLAVTQSTTLAARLSEHLTARWNAADEPPHYADSIETLSEALPGVQVTGGAEGVYGAPDYTALAKAVGTTSPSGRLLTAAHGWLGDFGKSTFLDWTSDISGCAQLGRSAERLDAIAKAWDEAPDCLRRVLQEPIADDLRSLAGWDCYCMSAFEIAHDAPILYEVLDRMPELGGPEAHAKIDGDLAAGQTRYETHVCGG